MKVGKRHIMLAGLVLALGAAVYLNWHFAPQEDFVAPTKSSSISNADLGKAEFVSANVSEDALLASASKEIFAKNRLERQTARDTVLDELEKQLKDVSADPVLKAQALESRTKHVNSIQLENTIETLVKTKGFTDCMVYITDDGITVLLPDSDGITAEKVSVVTEIVTSQTGAELSKIKITPVK